MLAIYCVALLPLLASCYPTSYTVDPNVATDHSQPALQCTETRLNELKGYWGREVGNLYTWLDDTSNVESRNGPFIGNTDDDLRDGCDDYDTNKHIEKYGCFAKNFLCAAKKVVNNLIAAHRHAKITYFGNQPWRMRFAVPPGYEDGHWEKPLTDDLRWVVKMRWDDPKLEFLRKSEDHGKLTTDMLKRMAYFILNNNIDEIANLFHLYQEYGVGELLKEQCPSKDVTPLTLTCKIVIVFDSITGLVDDNKAIGWDWKSDYPPKIREELAMLYLIQPRLSKIMDMSSVENQALLKRSLKTMFQSLFDNTLQKNTEGFKNHFGRFGNIRPIVERDCIETYNSSLDELTCYLHETFKRFHDLENFLGAHYNKWESPESRTRNVIALLWVLLTPKAAEYGFNPGPTDLTATLKHLLEIFYLKIQEKGLASLRYIMSRLPSKSLIGIDSGVSCRPNFEDTLANTKCAYTIMLENVVMFLDEFESEGGKTVKKLDMSVDYRYRLEQFKISSIRGAVESTKLELQSSLHEFARKINGYFEATIGYRFKHLRDYFTNVASYDEEIADADTGFITGKLNEFQYTARELARELIFDAQGLQTAAFTGSALDAMFMWVKAVARATSAVVSAIGGDFGGIVDAVDAADAAMAATRDAVKTDAVLEQIVIATATYSKIHQDLSNNKQQLENTRAIINKLDKKDYNDEEFMKLRDEFMVSYNGYTPMVTEAHIAKLDTAWGIITDNLDDQLSSLQTIAGISATMHVLTGNHVFKIKLLVPQLEATLSNRFDYQFQLIESLSEVMRTHNSMQAAKRLSKGFSDLETKEISLQIEFMLDQMALSTYIISQFHILLTLAQYCHYITYINIGVEPAACKKALATLDNAHIDEALSYQPPQCDMINLNVRIPTSAETGRETEHINKTGHETEHISPRLLNSGAQFLFQIPDFDWLTRNADISPEDETSGLYVKMFELYVITNSSYKLDHPLRVEVSASGPAPILNIPDEVKYELRPRSRAKFIFEYKENYAANCKEEINPYHVCTPGPKGICVQSRGEINNNLDVYPSIYTPWKIQLNEAIGNAPEPENTTKLFLQAKLKICRRTQDSNNIGISHSGNDTSDSEADTSNSEADTSNSDADTSDSDADDSDSDADTSDSDADASDNNVDDSDGGDDSDDGEKRRSIRSLLESDSPACPDDKYFDQRSRHFEDCGDRASPEQYHGYYCEKE